MIQRPFVKRNNLSVIPSWLARNPIILYMLSLGGVSLLYSAYSIPWYYIVFGILSVIIFFLYGHNLSKDLSEVKIRKEQAFEKRIFVISFIPRFIMMLALYHIYQNAYGEPFGYEDADAHYYDELGAFVADLLEKGNFHFFDEISRWSGHEEFSDMGQGIYVGIVYYFTGKSILVLRLLKCLLSSLTVVLVYRLSKRNFGIQVARNVAVLCALWPNFWYYCACHLKETEMVFLAVLFVEQADQMLRSRQFTAWKVIPILLIAAVIFAYRTPLGLVALLSLVFSVVISSSKVVSWGKRIIVGLLAILLIGVTVGNRIEEQSRSLLEQARGGQQKENMEWRSERQHGNAFAKYAGKSVFAPLIFTIPFPTMVRPWDGQEVQQLLNGGNFCKNIISGFTIFALVMLLLTGKWRDHLLPLSFMLGYIVVLTMSTFAQSERFHQPAMPFEFMFAAYGLSIAVTKPKYKRWFTYWCFLMFVACIAWNWFKLAGRGLT